jgi:hypothetical protein
MSSPLSEAYVGGWMTARAQTGLRLLVAACALSLGCIQRGNTEHYRVVSPDGLRELAVFTNIWRGRAAAHVSIVKRGAPVYTTGNVCVIEWNRGSRERGLPLVSWLDAAHAFVVLPEQVTLTQSESEVADIRVVYSGQP